MCNLNNDLGHTRAASEKDGKNSGTSRNIYIKKWKKNKRNLLSDFLRTERSHLPEVCSNEESRSKLRSIKRWCVFELLGKLRFASKAKLPIDINKFKFYMTSLQKRMKCRYKIEVLLNKKVENY